MASSKSALPNDCHAEILTGDRAEKLRKNYSVFNDGVLRVNPGGWIFPAKYAQVAHHVLNFEYSEKDILVMSFPKSGTTWVQEICWNLLNNPDQNNPLSEVTLEFRSPDLTLATMFSITGVPLPDNLNSLTALFDQVFPGFRTERENEDLISVLYGMFHDLPAPRVYRCHEPLPLMPTNLLETSKAVYIARNIYDTVTSYYHYNRLHLLWDFKGSLDEFVDDFIDEKLPFCPYFQHTKEAWDRRYNKNFLFIFYEKLKMDAAKEIKKIDSFLGTNRTDAQIEEVAKFTSFDSLKERHKDNPPTSNNLEYHNKNVIEKEGGFYRKGKIGDWKNHLSEGQREKLKAYAEKNLKMFGKDFHYNQFSY